MYINISVFDSFHSALPERSIDIGQTEILSTQQVETIVDEIRNLRDVVYSVGSRYEGYTDIKNDPFTIRSFKLPELFIGDWKSEKLDLIATALNYFPDAAAGHDTDWIWLTGHITGLNIWAPLVTKSANEGYWPTLVDEHVDPSSRSAFKDVYKPTIRISTGIAYEQNDQPFSDSNFQADADLIDPSYLVQVHTSIKK